MFYEGHLTFNKLRDTFVSIDRFHLLWSFLMEQQVGYTIFVFTGQKKLIFSMLTLNYNNIRRVFSFQFKYYIQFSFGLGLRNSDWDGHIC